MQAANLGSETKDRPLAFEECCSEALLLTCSQTTRSNQSHDPKTVCPGPKQESQSEGHAPPPEESWRIYLRSPLSFRTQNSLPCDMLSSLERRQNPERTVWRLIDIFNPRYPKPLLSKSKTLEASKARTPRCPRTAVCEGPGFTGAMPSDEKGAFVLPEHMLPVTPCAAQG